MSLIHSAGEDRLRALRTELADLRAVLGLVERSAIAAPIMNAGTPRIEPVPVRRNWGWSKKSERRTRRAT